MKTLDDVLEQARRDLDVLKRNGHAAQATAIERLIEEVEDASSPFRDWMSEADAQLRSGRSADWLRKRFPAWERQGLARRNPRRSRERQYLKVAIPLAVNLDAIRADAEREATRQAS